MVLITNNSRMWLIGMGVSLVLFAVVFFTVIQPSQNTANQALKAGLQQTHQALNQAQRQLSSAAGQAGAAGQPVKQALSKAAKLTSCVAAAGTDVSKVATCQTKFGD